MDGESTSNARFRGRGPENKHKVEHQNQLPGERHTGRSPPLSEACVRARRPDQVAEPRIPASPVVRVACSGSHRSIWSAKTPTSSRVGDAEGAPATSLGGLAMLPV